jgi:hypothetical protein
VASISELKERIDLHDLAAKLGLERPGGERGNYRSPHHKDKSPSLSVFAGGRRWKDFSSEQGGTCIDLVMYVRNCEVDEAMRFLHELYAIPFDKPQATERREKSRAEFIAEQVAREADACIPYLVEERKIPEPLVRKAIRAGALGFNTWDASKATPKAGRAPAQRGEVGFGGPAAAFIVRSMNPGHVVAVDLRYVDAELNGGVKTQTQGEKEGYPWYLDRMQLLKARSVYVFESAINALSCLACEMRGVSAIAVRGVNGLDAIDWRFLRGKRVVLCFDNDAPIEAPGRPEHGRRPGPEAAWHLYDLLAQHNIAAQLVDQGKWEENDANDVLRAHGLSELRTRLQTIEHWAIPGLSGENTGKGGRQRLFLPGHDFAVYWRWRVKEDFTTYVEKMTDDADGENGKKAEFSDVCGFRIASMQRVRIASAGATMNGDTDQQPRTVFAVTVQTPRHGHELVRRVLEDDKLHNIDQWKKFGPVFGQARLARLINIFERQAATSTHDAVNFVGLAWRHGRPVVNEGPDCYFSDPERQCPYHNLVFPSADRAAARRVIHAYQSTFGKNAAAQLLVWSLGGHLKAFTGFWPHMVLQASKGAGKSTLIKRLERTIGMTMFSGQSLQTEFRMLTSISATSHPVGWEEISARRQDIIDKAVSLLQECYQHSLTRRGAELVDFLISAPVLLAGEDVPVRSLTGKVVATQLVHKGPHMPDDLPVFPVRQWLEFLASMSKDDVREVYRQARQYCIEHCRARSEDHGGRRMVENYAAVATAWKLLCQFADLNEDMGDFMPNLVEQMNSHIAETSQDREPWVWILELLCSEISANRFMYPHVFDAVDSELVLIVRTSHVMDHIAHSNHLRDMWNSLPVKSDRVFKRMLVDAKMIVGDDAKGHERTVGGKRYAHMTAISVNRMESYGIAVPMPTNPADELPM